MGSSGSRGAWAVIDLGFGDAGKGATTDFLCREVGADVVVRFNGGAQAGHNVVTPDGRHHTFSQLGAGTFAGARTLLGPDFLLHPLGLLLEADHLVDVGVHDPLAMLAVHREARVITPFQQAANQIRERARGDAAHGTCGVGVGECASDSLSADDTVRAGDLGDPVRLARLLRSQRDRKRVELLSQGLDPGGIFDDPELVGRVLDVWGEVARAVRLVDDAGLRAELDAARSVVFEGAQGVLLDEHWGFHPHTTWSDCTGSTLGTLWDGPTVRLGVVRTYQTRHGAGPFPTEGTLDVPEVHNGPECWQGAFRTGALDGVLLRYALDVVGGVDGLAVTHLDRLANGPVCTGYSGLPESFGSDRLRPGAKDDLTWREALGHALRGVRPILETVDVRAWLTGLAPVALEAWGPTARERRLTSRRGARGPGSS
ncbi:MAG: adenylosuccinate synthetase [Alphaproteobacteria bacterium]|nr:adenylosuccinate synthetase [Alphaproteobacteria bacterium]